MKKTMLLMLCTVILAAIVLPGCSRTESLADPARKVTRQAIELEAIDSQEALAIDRRRLVASLETWNDRSEAFNRKLALARSDLDRQDAIKADIINGIAPLGELAVSGGLTAAGGFGAAANVAILFGLGMYARKQRGKAKQLEADQAVGLTPAGRAAIAEPG